MIQGLLTETNVPLVFAVDDGAQKRLSAEGGESLSSRIDSLNQGPAAPPPPLSPPGALNQGAVQGIADRIAAGGVPAALGSPDAPSSAPEGNFKGEYPDRCVCIHCNARVFLSDAIPCSVLDRRSNLEDSSKGENAAVKFLTVAF